LSLFGVYFSTMPFSSKVQSFLYSSHGDINKNAIRRSLVVRYPLRRLLFVFCFNYRTIFFKTWLTLMSPILPSPLAPFRGIPDGGDILVGEDFRTFIDVREVGIKGRKIELEGVDRRLGGGRVSIHLECIVMPGKRSTLTSNGY